MPVTKKKFTIEGIHCRCCALSLGMILRTVKGVSWARPDFDTKIVDVEFDDALANVDTMSKAIEGLGYRLKES